MQPSPVFFAASGAHMREELISTCGAASAAVDPYRRSMLRLLAYVGLQHYGTDHATVPPRTQAEDDAIAVHLEAVKAETARHQASVRARNIRISKRKATSALTDMLASAETAATAPAEAESTRNSSFASNAEVDNSGSSPAQGAVRQRPTIYLSFEDSAEWKAFLASVAPADRLAVTVRRRLTIELWRAHKRDLCLWCWFPRDMCMCAQLDAYKAAMPARVLDAHVEVTMLLHSEELMRSTNSGHIAAYLLGAPIRVWGMDADDFFLRELGPQCHREEDPVGKRSEEEQQLLDAPAEAAATASASDTPVLVYNVSLYPSSESIMIDEFIREKQLGQSEAARRQEDERVADTSSVVHVPGSKVGKSAVDSSHPLDGGTAISTAAPATHQPLQQKKKIHLILLDSTWGQALSLNRKLSKWIPRVKLEINDSYESLFQALRKRTRESGVSTLEATSMAIEQCVRAMGFHTEAAQATHTLTAAMKDFVDARCLMKYAAAQFTTDGVVLDAFRDRRDDARRDEAARRQEMLAKKMQHDAAARRLRLPPVLNYCYCCDCVIGWHRVAEHVLGRSHRTALERNPTCTPSAASRLVVVPVFARPTRAERAAEEKGGKKEEVSD